MTVSLIHTSPSDECVLRAHRTPTPHTHTLGISSNSHLGWLGVLRNEEAVREPGQLPTALPWSTLNDTFASLEALTLSSPGSPRSHNFRLPSAEVRAPGNAGAP